MAKISWETMRRQFTVINYICLAMIGSVFIYAALVNLINNGYIFYKSPSINNDILDKVKYILLFIAILFYFIIKLIQKKSSQSLKNYFQGLIIVFALCEAVGVFGLVLFLLSGNSMDFYIFMTISMLYFFIFYPRYQTWERLWRQETSTDTPA